MTEESKSQEFKMKNIEETRNYFIKEIGQNELNYIEFFLILASAITGCISISAFASLLGVSIVIPSSAIRLKICAIAAGIKKFKEET